MNNSHEIRTVRCAQCGEFRQEANHWFVVTVKAGRFNCMPLGISAPFHVLSHHEQRLKSNQQPACGQLCAQRLFERYLAAHASQRITWFEIVNHRGAIPAGSRKIEEEHGR